MAMKLDAPRYFITGTDTGIGKTYVTCQLARQWLAQGEQVKVLKPLATGCIRQAGCLVSEDKLTYEALQSTKPSVEEGWTFEPPVSPHLAASLSGTSLSAQAVAQWCQARWHQDRVLIEGAGGLMVPLNDKETWIDVLRLLQIPVIVVVGLRLGCLNHALLTVAALQAHAIPLAGWIANAVDPHCLYPDDLIAILRKKINAPYLGRC